MFGKKTLVVAVLATVLSQGNVFASEGCIGMSNTVTISGMTVAVSTMNDSFVRAGEKIRNTVAKGEHAVEKVVRKATQDAAAQVNAYKGCAEGLSNLNTMRGGMTGSHGFVAEELEALNMNLQGKNYTVINDNGPADLLKIGKNGHKYYEQVKFVENIGPAKIAEYNAKYAGQTLRVPKGMYDINKLNALCKANNYAIKFVEGTVSKDLSVAVSRAMQVEGALTGSKTATYVPRVLENVGDASVVIEKGSQITTQSAEIIADCGESIARNVGKSALQGAKAGLVAGGVISGCYNAYQVYNGDKEIGEAVIDTAVDMGESAVIGAAIDGGLTVIASTEMGAAALGAISTTVAPVTALATTAVTAAGTAITGATTVATGAVIGAATATGAAVTSAAAATGAAITGAAAATTGAVMGAATATGAVLTGAAAATSAAATAAGTAIAGAAIAAAPVAVPCAIAAGIGYGAYKAYNYFFGD